MNKNLIVGLTLVAGVFSLPVAAETINATGTITGTVNQFDIHDYKPCADNQYPLRDAFGHGKISESPANGGCVNNSCSYTFRLGDKTSVDYYESDGTQCIKKTATQSTPNFVPIYLAKVSLTTAFCGQDTASNLHGNSCGSATSAQGGQSEGAITSGDAVTLQMSYKTKPVSDQLTLKNGNVIMVAFQAVGTPPTVVPPSNQATTPITISSEKLEKFRKTILDNYKNQIPNLIPQQVASQLNMEITKCDPKVVYDHLSTCVPYSCYAEIPFFGMMTLESQKIIHGVNANKLCVFSETGKRFFVPAEKLNKFAYLVTAKPSSGSASASMGGAQSTGEMTQEVDGKKCTVQVKYDNVLDTTNLIEVNQPKTAQSVSNGTITSINGQTTITANGKTYMSKDPKSSFSYLSKLASFSLAPNSPKECTDREVLLPYELEKAGLTQDLPPPSLQDMQ